MEEKAPKLGYASLRRFRESRSGGLYFITTNLAERGPGLEAPGLTGRIFQEWQRLETAGLWQVRSAVVMPDHVHLLVGLGGTASVVACMRLLKGRLARDLRDHGLRWQEGFYEHQMRESEDLLPVFLYIFLNPYQADLLPADRPWPGYYCATEDWKWFGELTRETVPQSEWLR